MKELYENAGWQDTKQALLEGLDSRRRQIVDVALENQRRHLNETADSAVTSAGNIGNFQKIVNSNSPTVTDLNRALSEIAAAARAIRELADYLERHPEALIQGKGGPRK